MSDLPRCEIEGCEGIGFMVGHGLEPEHYYCPKHAHERGWCWRCGGFFGGVESFEFDGMCDDCQFIEEEIAASENDLYWSEGELEIYRWEDEL
jgi:hypothetical protein